VNSTDWEGLSMMHQDDSQTVRQKLYYSLADQEYCSIPQKPLQQEANWCNYGGGYVPWRKQEVWDF